MLTNKKLKKTLNILQQEINYYKEYNQKSINIDWKKYELELHKRVFYAISSFEYYIDRAIKNFSFVKVENRGCKPKLDLKQKVTLLLIKELMGKSNREMEVLCLLFTALTGVNVSYKTIERLYSDEQVDLVLTNIQSMFVLKIDTSKISVCGDGTGYSLTISKHYASEAQKLKDKLKKIDGQKVKTKKRKQKFIYAFKLMELKSRLYIAYGTSFKSEQQAYERAIKMAIKLGINIDDIRLDRYYSKQIFVSKLSKQFEGIKFYLIPKKNATIKGCKNWKDMITTFTLNVQNYLSEYFLRNNSESGFSEDKRRLGWKILQKLPERVDMVIFIKLIWHNLLWMAK